MKLLSAHIENFGALKNTDYTFSKGLNCICKENGAGKTTFAAFLCAMLYGMDTAKENDRQLKERAHYAPWNAGKFGGSLELETNGNTYRIERVFDPKSAAKDRLQCYLLTNGVKETELLPTPGEYLLGIPKDAFFAHRLSFRQGQRQCRRYFAPAEPMYQRLDGHRSIQQRFGSPHRRKEKIQA